MDLDTRARRAAQGVHRAVEVREMSLKLEEPKTVERFDRYQDRKQRNRRIGAIVVAVACVIAVAGVAIATGVFDQEAVPASPPDDGTNGALPVATATDIGTLKLTEQGCSVADAPSSAVAEGDLTITIVNDTDGPASFDISKFVPSVITFDELAATATEAGRRAEAGKTVPNSPPAGVAAGLFDGTVSAGRKRTFTAHLFAGDYAYVCFKSFPGAGQRPYAIDGPLVVAE